MYLPYLCTQEEAAIVNVSSALGVVPKENAPVYSASKAAVHIFSKSLRMQLETSTVKVFDLIPALVDTPMTNGRHEEKISPEALVDKFWSAFHKDQFETLYLENKQQDRRDSLRTYPKINREDRRGHGGKTCYSLRSPRSLWFFG